MGEMPEDVEVGSSSTARMFVITGSAMGVLTGRGAGGRGSACQAKAARKALIRITVSGTRAKPDKQPLPSSYWVAAVCQSVCVVRARGIVRVSFLGLEDPGSKRR